MKKIAVLLLGSILTTASVAPSSASTPPSSTSEARQCQFPIKSHEGRATCGASIFSVVSEPDRFAGKTIHVIGFMQVGDGKIDYFLVAPTELALEASDPYSCIRVEIESATIKMGGRPAKAIDPGLYVADTVGTLELTDGSWCVGTLHKSEVTVRWKLDEETTP